MGKDATVSSTTRPDAQTAQYQDIFRRFALGTLGNVTGNQALQSYAGPFGTGLQLPDPEALKASAMANFDRQRQQAGLSAADMATKAGAYGSDRSAILQAELTDAVNRNETQTLAGIDYQNQADQWARLMGLMGLAGQGGSYGGSTTTQSMPWNPIGTLIGGASVAGGLGWKPFA